MENIIDKYVVLLIGGTMREEMYMIYLCDEKKGQFTCSDCPDDFDCGLKAYPILSIGGKTYTQQELENVLELYCLLEDSRLK